MSMLRLIELEPQRNVKLILMIEMNQRSEEVVPNMQRMKQRDHGESQPRQRITTHKKIPKYLDPSRLAASDKRIC